MTGPAAGRREVLRDRLLVAGAAGVSLVASVSFMVGGSRIPFTSDQAVPALMALDIRDHGSHPVFHWGVFYNGSLEPHLLSLLFRVLPAGVTTYRLFLSLLVATTVLLAGETCRRTWGLRAGIVASLYLGLGPAFFFYKGLTSDGAYTSVLTALAAALLAATRMVEDERPRPAPIAALGFFAGLAWWIQPISAAFAPVVLLAIAARRHTSLRLLPLGLLALSFFAGSAPWWLENLRLGFPSLRMPELAAATKSGALEQASELLTAGWPMLLGARPVQSDVPTFPGAALFALLLILFLCATALARLRRQAPGPSAFLLAASVALVAMPPFLALSISRTDLASDVRFLIPSYLGLAPLVAFAVERLVASGRTALAGVLGVLLLALGPGSQLQAQVFFEDNDAMLRESSDAAIAMRRMGFRHVYGSFWLTYRLAFLGRTDLVPGSFGPGSDGVFRSGRFQQEVSSSEHPAFLLEGLDAARLAAFARSRGWNATRTVLPDLGLTVVSDLPPDALTVIRRCACIPAAVVPTSLEWLGLDGPRQVRQGTEARWNVAFRFRDHAAGSSRLRLTPWWRAADGTDLGRNDERIPLPEPLTSGRRIDMSVPLAANVPPGHYRLQVDLVDEHVTWFEWIGIPPASLEVEVLP